MDLQTALDSEVNRLRAPSPDANPATRAADASARGSGVPAAADAMTRAAEEAAARLEERLEVETRQDRKALRRPSRRMMIEKPEPDRLATVAADRGLDRVRALMGTSWTNRLAALLPEGWILGGCVGDDDGGRAERFEPPSFDRLECTRLCQVDFEHQGLTGPLVGLRMLVRNADEGRVEVRAGEETDPEDYYRERTRVSIDPGEYLYGLEGVGATGICIFSLTAVKTNISDCAVPVERIPSRAPRTSPDDSIDLLPPQRSGLVVRSFYGRVKWLESGRSVISGLATTCV
mmetsp:Transcript_14867/g.44340  ORF Transcript_14867/g.44340 Transcript_14867/m.44340 type:complete len:290 (-) Transcript_14867:6-875(-)